MNKPIPTPKACYLIKDKTYAYCTCNHSITKPYCDGSHKGTQHKPLLFKVPKNEKTFLCTCGSTKDAPYCDGSH
ncbi:CDGSH iron-sulfur domain-containing protein [Wenyingzhuangia aestuarii]|uniref:CDGSH iron-sulfur domain-containing protein n=1 Tax=Wenyingzhuangia aestuarii TaxID=1647582 RepID=UPI00143C4B0A|nr:CDGSH iron-sulfur domain-containing protein [Wenyingzhuangia aestuarii]NJB81539.1 CDGSH-type Zn-finger protein [Wenyingzhuangia aestuarii]